MVIKKEILLMSLIFQMLFIKLSYLVNQEVFITLRNQLEISKIEESKERLFINILDKPGVAAKIFYPLSKNNINVDMIVQNISQDGISANLTFTVQSNEIRIAKSLLEKNQLKINYKSITSDSNVAKVSVIGMGMKSQSGVAQKMFQTLADNKINILKL